MSIVLSGLCVPAQVSLVLGQTVLLIPENSHICLDQKSVFRFTIAEMAKVLAVCA